MKKYRITKYNPKFRNDLGDYTLDDWTSISDIGKGTNGKPTIEEYRLIEDYYVDSIKLISEEYNDSKFTIYDIEWNFSAIKSVKNIEYQKVGYEQEILVLLNSLIEGAEIYEADVTIAARAILREIIWARVRSEQIIIEFGYDYYMYLQCSDISRKLIDKIEGNSLFVERL